MYFCRQKENRTNASMFRTSNKYISREKIYETEFEFYALERIAHLIIDCVLDVGNAMIDGFIMRDPGSYEDIIDILMDERVISEEDGQGMKEIILLRKMLTQDYIQMNHDELYKTIQKTYCSGREIPSKYSQLFRKGIRTCICICTRIIMLIRSPENAFWGILYCM